MAERQYICFDHDDITYYAEEIIKTLNESENNLKYKEKRKIHSLLNKIIKSTKNAKDSGISMENRLHEYHAAIKGLGFERRKNKKK
jgi:hypothetical protein